MLASNGVTNAPPVAAVRDFMIENGAKRVTAIYHPLQPEDEPRHRIATYEAGAEPRERTIRLPSHPPHTYVFDPFVPLWPDRVDCGSDSTTWRRPAASSSAR